MRKLVGTTAIAAWATLALSGCSWWGGSAGLGGNNKTTTYDQASKEYQQRSLAAPAMGLDKGTEPGRMQKIGSAVAAVPGEVGSGIKSGASKVAGWVTPKSPSSEASSSNSSSASGVGLFGRKPEASTELRTATAGMYERAGDYASATQQYERALKQSPNDVPVLLSYAHMLDHQGKLPEAEKLYQRAVKANPREPATYNDLGLCLARRGKTADAVNSISTAVEMQPDKALYRNNLAMLLVQQGRSDEALAQLRSVHNEAVSQYNLGIMLQQQQQVELADTHFRRALELDPSFSNARDWIDRIAMHKPSTPPTDSNQRAAAPPMRVASVPAPTARDGSYSTIQATPPIRSYIQSERPPVTQAPPTDLGGRYETSSSTSYGMQLSSDIGRPNTPAMPPMPESLPSYRPALNSELRFLPPVE